MLHVEQQARYEDGVTYRRVLPINVFMREGGPPAHQLQILIERRAA